MQRRIVALVAFSLLAAPVAGFAQVRPRPATPPLAGGARVLQAPGIEIVEHILANREELGLTADQVTRIRTLRDAHVAQFRPLAEQLRAQRPDSQRANTMRERMQQQRERMQMTEEQRQQMRDRMRQRQDSMRARQDTARTRTRTQQDTVRTRTRPPQDTMRTRTRPPQDPRTTTRDSTRTRPATPRDTTRTRPATPRTGRLVAEPAVTPALRTELEALREANRAFVEQVNAVLTPAQRQKLSELRPRRGPGGR
jgi:hypothetical protein